ncbi:MAG: hypothetical protein VR64_24145 [Desulfatitalea sp. BRH_c12]|nr:MAG: hypothetical protein VR64_24145 [Desulfatitalea sp. BRH_c12]
MCGFRIGWIEAFDFTCIGTFSNHILPFRMGEAVFVYLSHKWWKIPTSIGIITLLTLRILDVIAMLIIFVFTILLVKPKLPIIGLVGGAAVIFALLVCALYLDCAIGFSINLIKKLCCLFHFRRKEKVKNFISSLEAFEKASLKLRFSYKIAIMLVLTTFVWLSLILFYQKIINSIGIEISYGTVIIGSIGASLAGFLPITLMGNIGILEAGWALGFILIGLSPSDATASGLLMHLIAILVVAIAASISVSHPQLLYQQIKGKVIEINEYKHD